MALSTSTFRVIEMGAALNAAARPTKLCHYITADAIATVVAANYFNGLASQLAIGDIILCSCGSGATLTTIVVATNDGVNVTTVKTA